MREAEEMLRALSPDAVAKLKELLSCGDLKIESTVALGVVKVTIGELQRVANAEGGNVLGIDFKDWTPEQVLELAKSSK